MNTASRVFPPERLGVLIFAVMGLVMGPLIVHDLTVAMLFAAILLLVGFLLLSDQLAWIILSAALPFWAFYEFRLPLGGFQIDPSLAMAAVCVLITLIQIVKGRRRLTVQTTSQYGIILFSISTLLSFSRALFAGTETSVLSSAIRVTVGALLGLSLLTRPRAEIRQMVAAFGTSATLLLALAILIRLYQGQFILSGSLLGDTVSRGKNQVAVLITPFYALAFSHFFLKSDRLQIRDILIVTVAAISGLMSFSRAAWVACLAASGLVFLFSRRKGRAIVGLIIVAVFVLLARLDVRVYVSRFLTLFRLDDFVSGSVALRRSFAQSAVAAFQSSPLLGRGLGYFMSVIGQTPHNDFYWILGERGVIGLVAFLMIFAPLLYELLRPNPQGVKDELQISLGVVLAGFLVLFLANDSHEVLPTWFFVGLTAAYAGTSAQFNCSCKNE